jgi:hypothetical protein
MGLNEAFQHDRATRKWGSWCKTGLLLNELNTDDHDTLVEVLNDPTWSSTRISDVLKTEAGGNHQISPHTIARHRAKRCQCS